MRNLSFDDYEKWCSTSWPAGAGGVWKRQHKTIWHEGEEKTQDLLFQHHYRSWLNDPDLASLRIASSLIRYFELARDPVDVLGEDYFA